MGMFADRLRQVLRRLGRAKMFTAITLITLAVGVGANTVIFSVVEGVLLKPLAYPDSERLIGIWHTAPGIGIPDLNTAPFLYFIDREQNKTLEDTGAYTGDSVTVTGAGDPQHVNALDVTSSVLPILRVLPAMGRDFTEADNAPGAPPTAMISYAYWQQKFGSSNDVIGKMISADGLPRQIVGVLPRDFHFLDREDDSLLLPMGWDRSKTKLGQFSFDGIARLKPGVTLEQANADMARLLPIAIRSFPPPEGFSVKLFDQAKIAPNLKTLKKVVVGDVGKTLWVLMGSIGMVMLIACANVANLLLVRVEGRRQELAVRAALGAGLKGIIGDLMFESLVLGVTGSLFGLALAYGALRLLVALAPTGLPRIHEIGIDVPVLLFTLGLALLSSLLIGFIPVIKYAGKSFMTGLNAGLREGSRGQSQSKNQHVTRSALVVFQVALALVLLICSGLMIRTFHALTLVRPGFDAPDSLQTFHLFIPDTQITDKEMARVLHVEQEIQDKLAGLPGVTSVAFGSGVPMDGHQSNDPVSAQDRASHDGELTSIRRFKFVAPGYFAAVGTPLIAGRDYTWTDSYQKLPVTIVSENLARELWHDPRNALGKRIRVTTTEDWREIIGVVGDVHDDGVSEKAPSMVYWPAMMGQFEGDKERVQRGVTYAIRTPRAGSAAFMREVQAAVWSTNGNLPLSDVHTLGYFYTKSMARTSFTLVMLSVAGTMALLLGVVGIYGVISYTVSQRTREIGIRMALGAQRQAITAMFVRGGLVLTAIGVGFGLVAALVAMRLMSSLLFNVSPVDPLTYGVITVGIVLVAYIACYLPSRRASAVDPMDALRAE